MTKKSLPIVTVRLDKIVGGGQALATESTGRKLFVWGGLPGELVEVQLTKKKSKLAEGVVVKVIEPGKERVPARNEESFLSTSPWQIMDFKSEQHYKSALIEEAFELLDIVLPKPIEVFTDNKQYEYRNKVEFSWWWNKETEQLDLAFFKRGTHGKIPVEKTDLANPNINKVAIAVRDLLRSKKSIRADTLKTLLVRCDSSGKVVVQLYVKDQNFKRFAVSDLESLGNSVELIGFELIFSNPKSPASIITKRLQSWGINHLTDTILDVPFTYAIEGFFQVNIPVYIQALKDIKKWINPKKPVVDLYSGVGTIGLTTGNKNVTMIEIDEQAVREMKRNITRFGHEKDIIAILASSENSLEYIANDSTIIVDPPRVGLHENVIKRILEVKPKRVIYLSCNPVTQARDVASLAEKYSIRYHKGYNFFPRTPHIEHLVILELKN